MTKNSYIGARVSLATVAKVDMLAEVYGVSRSDVVRGLLDHCEEFYGTTVEALIKAGELEDNLADEVINMLPDEYTNHEMALLISRIIMKVAEKLEKGGKES